MTEEMFRALLDARGVLKPGALTPPDPSTAYLVFAQRADASLDLGAIKQQASRFFRAKLGLTVAKRYGVDAPHTDVARIVLATDDGSAAGTRLCFGRPADPNDWAAAERAEQAQGTSGMALLAQRCKTVWLIERETAEDGTTDDRTSLTIAAILASVLLGPILPPSGQELFGVRTARLKLEARSQPYR